MSTVDLDALLGNAERVLLDTSAFIAFHNRAELVHPLARHLLERIEAETDLLRGYCSVITASELLVRPIRTSRTDYTFMHTFLTSYPNLTMLPMDLHVATQAATVRAANGLRLPDAIVVATAMLAGCEAVVTNDEQWKRRVSPLFARFNWLYLGDYV